MKLIITLLHEPGEDRDTPCEIGGGVTLHYPELGHIVVHAKHVTLESDEYETLGSRNLVHAAGAAYLVEAAAIDTAEPIEPAPIKPAPVEPPIETTP